MSEPPLVLIRRTRALAVVLALMMLASAAAAISFLTGPWPNLAGAGLFGAVTLGFAGLYAWFVRTERLVLDRDRATAQIESRGVFHKRVERFPLDSIAGARIERVRVRSQRLGAGETTPRWIDAERPALLLTDGRVVPIFHLALGTRAAEQAVSRIRAWLSAADRTNTPL